MRNQPSCYFPCIHQWVLHALRSTHAIPYEESGCLNIPLVDLKLVQEADGVGVRRGGGAEDTRDGESRDGPVLPEQGCHGKPVPCGPRQQCNLPPQHYLVGDVIPVAQMHSRFTTQTPSLSHATFWVLTDTHDHVQFANIDTRSPPPTSGRAEVVERDLLDP